MNRVALQTLILVAAASLLLATACDDGKKDAGTTTPMGPAKSGEFVPGAADPAAKTGDDKAAPATFKGAGEFLPKPDELDGFKLTDGPDYYTKDNLFEVIDGGADSYIGYGTTDMVKAVYTPTGEFKEEVNAEIYQFSTKYGSLGKFSEERSACQEGHKLGDNWCPRKSDLIFWKGQYLIKVQTFDDSAPAEKAVMAVAAAVDKKIKDAAALPPFVAKFPEDGKLAGTAGWRNRAQFGFDGLKDLLIQKYQPPGDAYKEDDAQVTLFGGEQKSGEAASGLFDAVTKVVEANAQVKEKGGVKKLDGVGDKAIMYSDAYGTHTLVLKGSTVAGGRDFQDPETATALTTKLAEKLRVNRSPPRVPADIRGAAERLPHELGLTMAKAGDITSPYKKDDIDRRSFLKVATGSVVGATAFAGGAVLLYDRENDPKAASVAGVVRDYTVPDDPAKPQVVEIHGSDPEQTLARAVERLGGISRFIARGDRVAIKPNIGWDRVPKHAANTNPVLVAKMVELCLAAGASEVVVTDASCNDPNRAYQKSGIGQAAYNAGARVLLPRKDRFREMPLEGKLLKKWPVYTPLVFADKVINMAICKHHNLTNGLTAGMKNWYGILGGQRNLLHQDIHQSIFDLTNFMRPTLTVLDAIRVLVRNGPQGGSFSDTAIKNTIVVGTDQVAIDTIAAGILGLDPATVGYLTLADGKLGNMDLNKVRLERHT